MDQARKSTSGVYGYGYRKARRELLADNPPCALQLVCQGDPAETADHEPPLSQHDHVPGSGCCKLVPACARCNKSQGGRIAGNIAAVRRAEEKAKKLSLPAPSRAW